MKFLPFRPVQSGYVVQQGIKPHIGYISVVKREINSPGQPGFRPGYAQIVQGVPEHGQDFVSILFGLDEIRVLLDMIPEPVLVLGHAEKVVGLLDIFWFFQMIRTESIHQLSFCIKTLTAEAIMAAVFTEIDIPIVIDKLQKLLHRMFVLIPGGPDKLVVDNSQFRPQRLKHAADPVHIGLRVLATGLGGLHDFVPVLIRAG